MSVNVFTESEAKKFQFYAIYMGIINVYRIVMIVMMMLAMTTMRICVTKIVKLLISSHLYRSHHAGPTVGYTAAIHPLHW